LSGINGIESLGLKNHKTPPSMISTIQAKNYGQSIQMNQMNTTGISLPQIEVAECPTSFIEGKYLYYFIKAVDKFKDWVVYNRNLPSGKTVKRKELAEIIRAYQEDQDAEIVPALSRYQTMKVNKGKAKEDRKDPKITEMEREWEEAHGLVKEFDLNDEGNLDEDCELLTA
jgi:hypothetical protein